MSTVDPFELALLVQPTDIDEIGHVNNVTYLRWIQEVAIAHWESTADAATRASLFWVVVRHEIDYLHSAYLTDALIARTWVGPATRLRFERNTEILRAADRKVLARARSLWCPCSTQTGKPTAVSIELRERFSLPTA
jgi:acyl-CoA thioester hydrolase